MHSDASTGGYMMHAGGGGGAATKTPRLGVEIGGGMAADCTHAHFLRTQQIKLALYRA
jgi:hypothetical protein